MRKIQLGPISSDTTRTEDLLDAVIGETEHLFGAHANMPTELRKAYTVRQLGGDIIWDCV